MDENKRVGYWTHYCLGGYYGESPSSVMELKAALENAKEYNALSGKNYGVDDVKVNDDVEEDDALYTF